MGVNREKPHLMVLPEDDANRQIADGFQLHLDWAFQRQIQILNPPGGWRRVIATFESDHVPAMERNRERFLGLLIDFDDDLDRQVYLSSKIPPNLADRVFILGCLSEPERLKSAGLGTYEEIGAGLAKECRDQADITWRHKLLQHNAGELDRLRLHVRPILF